MRKEYSLGLIGVLLVVLSACAPIAPSDPDIRIALAEADKRETEQAQLQAAAMATQQAAVRQAKASEEIAVVMAPVQAEQTRLALSITQGAATDIAARSTATAQADLTTATVIAAQATSTQAFANLQLETARHEADRDAANARFWDAFWPIVTAVAIGLILVGMGVFGYRMLDWTIEWIDRRKAMYETAYGLVVWKRDENSGQYEPYLLSEPQNDPVRSRSLPTRSEIGGVERLTASGSVLSSASRHPDNSTAGLALYIVRESMRRNGKGSDEILSWRQLDITSDKWQRAMAAMKAMNLVETQPGSGTHLVGRTLYQMETALEHSEIKLRPAPYPNEG